MTTTIFSTKSLCYRPEGTVNEALGLPIWKRFFWRNMPLFTYDNNKYAYKGSLTKLKVAKRRLYNKHFPMTIDYMTISASGDLELLKKVSKSSSHIKHKKGTNPASQISRNMFPTQEIASHSSFGQRAPFIYERCCCREILKWYSLFTFRTWSWYRWIAVHHCLWKTYNKHSIVLHESI